MKKSILCILITIVFLPLAAQDIAQGTWRTHFSYRSARIIENTASKIFCATENGLFFVDKNDQTVNVLTTMGGLSDVGVSALGYSESQNTLVIGYRNGNIDLMDGNGITNISLVKEQNLLQNKEISHISFFGEKAYLSTDFGIVVIDLGRQLLEEVFREIGPEGQQPEVFATHTAFDSIFAVTSLGFQSAPLTTGSNLLDFNNWVQLSTPTELIHITGNSDSVIVADDQSLYNYQNGDYLLVSSAPQNIERLTFQEDENVYVIAAGVAYQYNGSDFLMIENEGSESLSDILLTDGELWLADSTQGLKLADEGRLRSIIPNGPFSDEVQNLVYNDTAVFAFGPFRNRSFQPLDRKGYSYFTDGRWKEETITGFNNPSDISTTYLASFDDGLLQRADKSPVTNAPFTGDAPSGSTLVTDIEEKNEELWVANFNSNFPAHRFSAAEGWVSYDLNGRAGDIAGLAVSRQVWIHTVSSSGITILDPESGEVSVVNQNNSDLPSSAVNDLAIDLDDEVWVATDAGVAFFPSASAEFSNFNTAIRPIFENNFLFRDEVINCITIDPGNRKWIGTLTGAWLLEEAGESLVRRFTSENSPLPSDNVLDIAIDPQSGEVFFSTDKGMASFRSDATISEDFHSNVKIFPNPVRPRFDGLVGISGLATDVRLKITDISGKLIRELEANGGGASWDLRDINGNRAQTGIYLLFSADREGVETYIGKLAVVN